MSAAVFDVLSEVCVDIAELAVLACQSCDLLVAFVHLVDSQPEGVLCLIEHLGQVIVAHGLGLGGFVVVQGLAFELFGESSDLGDVLLQCVEICLRVGSLGF